MGYAGRHNIYEATIKRMVAQAIEQQEQEFAAAHSADTDEQLLTYLRQCAVALGHTPWPKEIVGGSLIEQRFGGWQNALTKSKLPHPTTQDVPMSFARMKGERVRQEIEYRRKKAEKKLRAQQRQANKKHPV